MATRVAIVGSGIGGLVLAKTLTQYGAGKVEVKLYEAWDEWKTRGGSLGIQQSIEILEKLGLKEPNAGGFKEASTNFSTVYNMSFCFFWNTSNWRLTRITVNF